jgi:hypothetical protein
MKRIVTYLRGNSFPEAAVFLCSDAMWCSLNIPKFQRNLLPPSKGWKSKALVKPCFSFLFRDFLLIFPHGLDYSFTLEDVGSTSIRTADKFLQDCAVSHIVRRCSSYLSPSTFGPLKLRPLRCLESSGTNHRVIKCHIVGARRRRLLHF